MSNLTKFLVIYFCLFFFLIGSFLVFNLSLPEGKEEILNIPLKIEKIHLGSMPGLISGNQELNHLEKPNFFSLNITEVWVNSSAYPKVAFVMWQGRDTETELISYANDKYAAPWLKKIDKVSLMVNEDKSVFFRIFLTPNKVEIMITIIGLFVFALLACFSLLYLFKKRKKAKIT